MLKKKVEEELDETSETVKKAVEAVSQVFCGDVPITFKSGARRASIKSRYDLIPMEPLRRLATVYEMGNDKYGKDNWKKGMPWSDILNHVIDHLLRWKDGELEHLVKCEDHLAHAAWGLFALMYFESGGKFEYEDIVLLSEEADQTTD